jgi:hypothetical protein
LLTRFSGREEYAVKGQVAGGPVFFADVDYRAGIAAGQCGLQGVVDHRWAGDFGMCTETSPESHQPGASRRHTSTSGGTLNTSIIKYFNNGEEHEKQNSGTVELVAAGLGGGLGTIAKSPGQGQCVYWRRSWRPGHGV